MPGLFDFLLSGGYDDSEPGRNAQMALAAGLMGGKGSFGSILGNSLMGAQDTYRTSKKDQQAAEFSKAQIDELRRKAEEDARKVAEAKRLQAAQDAFRSQLTSPQMQASQAALAGGGGPTLANAAEIPKVDPTQDLMFKAMQSGLMSPLDYVKLQQKDDSPHIVPQGGTLVRGNKSVFTSPAKPENQPEKWRLYQLSGAPEKGISFDDWNRANLSSGATRTKVEVNTGQKGYENESKLRNDFKSEPIYKDYADMQTAHKQIKAGIAAGNPIGDVATATKVMKLLDPGSVVRESELAIAMAAGGRMDRLRNFVELQLKGEKLTPTQRAEFGALADELMEAAGQAYNQKRSEYAQFGKSYGLSDAVLGPQYKTVKSPASQAVTPPAKGGGWSIKPLP